MRAKVIGHWPAGISHPAPNSRKLIKGWEPDCWDESGTVDPGRALCGIAPYPANTKHLYNICTMLNQRRRRWADVVQMLYKCFVFARRRRWADVVKMLCKCFVFAGYTALQSQKAVLAYLQSKKLLPCGFVRQLCKVKTYHLLTWKESKCCLLTRRDSIAYTWIHPSSIDD